MSAAMPPVGAVLITGASTGIGRATAERLSRAGIPVLAGVRREEDAQALAAIPGVEPLILDITRAEHLDALRERISGGSLRGVVNNAGIAVPGPLEELPLDELRRQFEVNVFGGIAVVQATLPALRIGHGRVVNVGSIAGRVAQTFVGAYAGSKGAVHLMSSALRRELRPWGIWVACVEPGVIDTEIWGKGQNAGDELLATLSPEGRARYGAQFERMRDLVDETTTRALSPDEVAERIEHALTAPRPKAYYLIGRDAQVLRLIDRLPARASDRIMERILGL